MGEFKTKPYRPSSGTAGDAFMNQFCYQCKKDGFNGVSGESCQIVLIHIFMMLTTQIILSNGYKMQMALDALNF